LKGNRNSFDIISSFLKSGGAYILCRSVGNNYRRDDGHLRRGIGHGDARAARSGQIIIVLDRICPTPQFKIRAEIRVIPLTPTSKMGRGGTRLKGKTKSYA
jgi:hypothetical protein